MRIIGLSSDYVRHDTSICLVEDGEVVFASPEERFSGLKHDPRAPIQALTYLLESRDITLDDIDAIAVGLPAFDVMKGVFDCSPFDLFSAVVPVLLKDAKNIFGYYRERLADSRDKQMGFEWIPEDRRHYISHYVAHAASAYRTSGYDEALAITLDAAGSDEMGHPFSGSIFTCKNGEITLIEGISRYASMACFYNVATQAVGFKSIGEDWKLMGLAAFGNPDACYEEVLALTPRFENGKWRTNRYSIEAKFIDRPSFLKQTALWRSFAQLVDQYGDRDVAAAAQKVFEDRLIEYFRYLLDQYGIKKLVLAGGAFHNIKLCMRMYKEFEGIEFYVQPAAGDEGAAIGAALELYHRLTGKPTNKKWGSVALGAEYSDRDIRAELTRYEHLVRWEKPADIAVAVAKKLVDKKVVGIFQGRTEWGPRALGQRSVIADPRDPAARDRINLTLKNREWFMPFAPSIIEEDGPRYLKGYFYSPYMTHAFDITEEGKNDLCSAVHLDDTVRPQIVRSLVVPHYHRIISAFKELTGVGGVLNTSFNRHGLPIVNHPRDAILHLIWGCVDSLAIGDYIVERDAEIVPFKKRFEWSANQLIKNYDVFDDRLLAIRHKRAEEGPDLK